MSDSLVSDRTFNHIYPTLQQSSWNNQLTSDFLGYKPVIMRVTMCVGGHTVGLALLKPLVCGSA